MGDKPNILGEISHILQSSGRDMDMDEITSAINENMLNNDVNVDGLLFSLLYESIDCRYKGQYEKIMGFYKANVGGDRNLHVPDRIQTILDHYFITNSPELLALREVLANQIELKQWNKVNTDSMEICIGNTEQECQCEGEDCQEDLARWFLNTMITDVDNYFKGNHHHRHLSLIQMQHLQAWLKSARDKLIHKPLVFVETIKIMLAQEASIINIFENPSTPQPDDRRPPELLPPTSPRPVSFPPSIPPERQELLWMGTELKHIQGAFNEFWAAVSDHTNNNQVMSDPSATQHFIQTLHQHFTSSHLQTIRRLETAKNKMLVEIKSWQRRSPQLRIGCTKYGGDDIESLHNCCTFLGKIALENIQQYQWLRHLFLNNEHLLEQTQLPILLDQTRLILTDLIQKAFVVVPCHEQILKRDAKGGRKFQCKVRHFMSGCLQGGLEVTLNLVSKVQAEAIIQNPMSVIAIENEPSLPLPKGKNKKKESFDILKSSRSMLLKNLQCVTEARERDATGPRVAETKYFFLATADVTFQLPGPDGQAIVQNIKTHALSFLPVIVTSHTKQMCDSEATLFWDNSFSNLTGPQPFDVPSEVRLHDFLEYLEYYWIKKVKGDDDRVIMLNDDAKYFLTNMIFGDRRITDTREMTVTKDQILHLSLHKQNHTFWKWFYDTMDLVRNPLVRDFWNEGYIAGFLSRHTANELLINRPPGTFLLRFSTQPGKLVICCRDKDEGGVGKVNNYDPDDKEDFKKKPLAGMIMKFNDLTHLYPNIPKDDTFGKYYKGEEQKSSGVNDLDYIRKLTLTSIIGRQRLTYLKACNSNNFYNSTNGNATNGSTSNGSTSNGNASNGNTSNGNTFAFKTDFDATPMVYNDFDAPPPMDH